ncbi:MAG: hypothetical protein FJ104_15470, partial [Deltaproteobacteria bacterium]|nr:hypothetical protein [Deltaproteobacteria bacterium]
MSRRTRAAVLVALLSLFACAPALEPSAREGERRVTLLAFSDLHSRLLRSAGDPGLGALAACLTAEAATADHPVFVLDAGDLVEGGILFPRFGGEPELRAAALLGVDAQALGNHDQQLGPGAGAELRRRLGVSPPLAANLPGGVPFRVLDRD